MKFNPGTIVMTRSIKELITSETIIKELELSLRNHLSGNWGNLSDEDKQANEDALLYNDRIFSSYDVSFGTLWIITEHDRSATTLLLPQDY